MRILLLLTSVFGLTGGVHTFNRALIKATDDLASDFRLDVTVFSLLDGEVPFQAAADYMSSVRTRYRGFKGNKRGFAAATLLAGWRANRVVLGHVNFSSLACGMPKPIKSLVVHGLDVWRPLPSLQKLGISQMREILFVSEYTQETSVADRVVFTGFVADELLPSYYDAYDLFVLPSLREGFGIVFLEAMYHAKACVGARAGGIPEVVKDGGTGLLAKPDSVDSFVLCVVRLLGNGQERGAMGRRGKERLEREFSCEKFRARLERVLC
jgi:hypothetical protein